MAALPPKSSPASVGQPMPAEWMPISSAPRDGTRILLFNGREVSAGAWMPVRKNDPDAEKYPWSVYDNDVWQMVNAWTDGKYGASHWMPLPKPPEPPQ